MSRFEVLTLLIILCLTHIVLSSRTQHKRDKPEKDEKDDDQDKGKGENWARLGRLAYARAKRQLIQQDIVQQVYDNVVWPKGAEIVYNALWTQNFSSVEHIFDPNVFIKLPPLGEFEGILANLEYFYGLAGPVRGGIPTPRRVTSVKFLWKECWANICTFRVLIQFLDFATNLTATNFTHHGVVAFNSQNKICGGEINFVHQAAGDIDPVNPTALASHRAALCNTVQAQCSGNNTQYASVADCLSFVSSLQYGGFYHDDRNTTACRTLHLSLQRISPLSAQRHCPHSGPSGGGKCFDKNAAYYYTPKQTDFINCRDPNW